jgi:hypothetical protein
MLHVLQVLTTNASRSPGFIFCRAWLPSRVTAYDIIPGNALPCNDVIVLLTAGLEADTALTRCRLLFPVAALAATTVRPGQHLMHFNHTRQ